MHIISRKRLVLFALTHADSEVALDTWDRTAKSAEWQNLVELREAYPSADLVDIYTVFNIKGNHYRLIAEINYRIGTIFVRNILTHAEYDKEQWKS
ncbi:type II toxin-antitoxin system HigB family toxin [Chamaesiphon sp.]|uniref:type II toxin-antitoxin system HigB family toxin n=1 Tax=Chamaesiphon sp. TaxID=2814140 RepID=UPI0035932435